MNSNVAVPCAIVVTALAIVVLLGTGSARPVQTVSYSYDGETWGSSLPTPLFDGEVSWVPGDRRDVRFHVFNDTDTGGRLQVLVNTDDREFGEALRVSILDVESSAPCGVAYVGAHQKRRIDVAVTMAIDAGNRTQNAESRVDLEIRWDNQYDEDCISAVGIRDDELEGTVS